ncbi:MFS transporter [Tunicatimonas pelagia]|uniref:MFS transporter n=1 Tax=Tunicatimonas pelagia TaxID=931531 RepID=UPI0026650886|nr:MFS transporter [Tunicatimonas pelagia]WKN42185.1 MFS transporter [Tunicatimonas pelagia]
MNSQTNSLGSTQVQRGLNLVLREGLATQSMIILTSGAFLIAFALELGATPLQIGIISSIPLYSNVLQILSIELVRRWRSRKRVVVIGTLVGRSAYAGIALLPLLPNGDTRLYLMMVALAVQHGMGAVSNGSWSSWMRDLIPDKQRGRFLSHRLVYTQIISIALSLGVAFLLDRLNVYYPGQDLTIYAALFMIGSLAGIVGSFLLAKTPEPIQKDTPQPLLSLLLLPFQHTNFRQLMAYMASWNFAVNIASPFLTVYLLQTVGLSMTYVIGLTTLSQLGNIAFFRFWGYYADRFSNKTILRVSAPLYLFALLGTVYATLPEVHTFTLVWLVILFLLAGVGTAGTGLASSSIGLALAPRENSVAYLSVLSLINALASGTAPILAGLLASYTQNWNWTLSIPMSDSIITLISLRHWDFLFVLSFLLGLYALYRLRLVREPGGVQGRFLVKVVIANMRQEQKLRQHKPWILTVPISVYAVVAKPQKNKKAKAVS